MVHKQTGIPQFISNISSVLGRENVWIQTIGHRLTHSHDNKNYIQSRKSIVKSNPVYDRLAFFSDNGRGRGRITQTVHNTIKDNQIATQI